MKTRKAMALRYGRKGTLVQVLTVGITTALALLSLSSMSAGNLIVENSSFEAGRWGYDAAPDVYQRNWSKFVYPEINAETAAHGKYSLKISNPTGMDAVMLCFPAVEFKEKTHVVGSFYAKSDVPGAPVSLNLCCGWKGVVTGSAKLTTEWQRYSFEGDVGVDFIKETSGGGNKRFYALKMVFASAQKPVFGTIWIDAVQLENDKLTDYAPAKTVDASLDMEQYPERRILLYTVGERETADLRIVSYAGKAAPFKAEWKLTDVLSGAVVASASVSGTLDEKGYAREKIPLPPVERRLYLLSASMSVEGAVTAEAKRVFGGIRDLSAQPMKSKIFGGSLETTEEARTYIVNSADPTYRMTAWNIDPEIYLKAARKAGWRWIHTYRQTGPRMIMEAPDKFYYEDTDHFVDILRRNDFEIMALLTSHGNYQTQYDFPKWIQTGTPSKGGTSAGKGAPLPDTAAYGRFCYEMANRYKGKIDIWENWNEPGVKMREEEYLPLAKTCYENVKKANPNATVLGLCGTWDVGGDLYGWVKSCLKIGAGDYMDAIAIHGYHTLDRDYVGKVRELAKSLTGKTYPVWDTESGAYIAPLYGYKPYFGDSDTLDGYKPDALLTMMSRHFANEMASGVERQSWFNLADGWTNLGKPDMALFNFDGSPDAALIGQNFMIELYDEAKIHKDVPVEGNSVAYVFDRPTAPFAVYWNPVFESEALLPLAGVEVLDMMGAPLGVKAEGAGTIIPIGGTPRYIVAKGASPADLAAAVAKMEIKGISLVKVAKTLLGVNGSTPTLVATLDNTSAKEQTVAVSTMSKPDWLASNIAETLTLAPFRNKEITWELPVTTPESGGVLRVGFENGAHVLAVPVALKIIAASHADGDITVDAVAGKAAFKNSVPLADWVDMAAAWNDKGLYFLFTVKDNAIVNYKDYTAVELPPWKSDCVEVFFDWDRQGDLATPLFNADDTQLIFIPKGDGEKSKDEILKGADLYAGNAKFPLDKVAMKTSRTADGYAMEIGIPWECLTALGVERKSVVGFTVSIRDHGKDYTERKRAIWTGADDNYKDTSKFGLLIMK